jgi:Ca2+-binding EF-hand superfamily protein
LGDKMTDKELDEMMATADSEHHGFINYECKMH